MLDRGNMPSKSVKREILENQYLLLFRVFLLLPSKWLKRDRVENNKLFSSFDRVLTSAL